MAEEKDQKPLQLIPDEKTVGGVVREMRQVDQVPEFTGHMMVSYGTLALTREQQQILEEPIPVEDIDILGTGEIYVSQVQYRRRLNQAFRPGGWAMIKLSQPTIRENIVMQEWGLYVSGILVSTAWGEQEYFPNNPRMSYATALEAAKSNALTRCCKDLGIGSECWDKHYAEQFKADHCEAAWVNNRKVWKRKQLAAPADKGGAGKAEAPGSSPRGRSTRQPPAPPDYVAEELERSKEPIRPPDIPPSPHATELRELIKKAGEDEERICKQCGVKSLEQLTEQQYQLVLRILKGGNNEG